MKKRGREHQPTKVPASRITPRLNVAVKSGFSMIAIVIGIQYERGHGSNRASESPIATQSDRRTACRHTAEFRLRLREVSRAYRQDAMSREFRPLDVRTRLGRPAWNRLPGGLRREADRKVRPSEIAGLRSALSCFWSVPPGRQNTTSASRLT